MSKKTPEEPTGKKIIIVNKKARFDYHILETIEAGLVLTGSEIKSIRNGKISISESYVRPFRDGIYLLNANIPRYAFNAQVEYDPERPRKLLLHKNEIDRLRGRVETKGLTIIPLEVYLKKGYAKIAIALAQGKNAPDKRSTIKDRESKRELSRVLKKGE